MDFIAQALLSSLRELQCRLPHCRTLVVGFSGGLDSQVLLHALHGLLSQSEAALGFGLRAVHVHHGLSPLADDWEAQCRRDCELLDVPFTALRVHVSSDARESLEERARQARYQAFEATLQADECLLLAHHQDDQAETLLLRLMRGAGPRGLAAMPLTRSLGSSHLWRPLLELSRRDLEHYAQQHQLRCVDDHSNEDQRFDRNFLRHSLLPLLEERWPGYRSSWQRSAQLCAEAETLLIELAEQDLAQVSTPQPRQIRMQPLQALSAERQRNVLRHWLRGLGFAEPGWHILQRCLSELLPAASDAQPELIWQGHELRRFDGRLYALRSPLPLQAMSRPLVSVNDFSVLQRLPLENNGFLEWEWTQGAGLKLPSGASIEVVYRSGGEVVRLAGRRSRQLKKILHDARVPPWLRPRLPLLSCAGQIVCIPGIGTVDGWQAQGEEAGLLVHWHPEPQ